MSILDELPKPLLIAHRGASACAPENTISAFRLAFESGCPAIELDTKLTADGKVVVIHDQRVDRTTDGIGNVKMMEFKTLRELDAGRKFSNEFTGERIPSLKEVLETFSNKLYFNIELTNYLTPFDQLPIKAASLVKKFNLENRVFFSSFFMINLIRIKQEIPGAVVAIITLKGGGFLASSGVGRRISPQVIHPHISSVDGAYIHRQHQFGRRVHAWVGNSPQEITRLAELGADGIFTDNPRLAGQILRV